MNIISAKTLGLWLFTVISSFNMVSLSNLIKYPSKILSSDSGYTVSVVSPPMKLGEGPYWSVDSQKLYCVDIDDQKLYSYNPQSEEIYSSSVSNAPLTYIIGVQDQLDDFIVGIGRNLSLVHWDDDSNEVASLVNTLITVDTDRTDTRFNDAKIDSNGRFWGGTMGLEVNSEIIPHLGSFYSIDQSNMLKKHLSSVSISNGIAWNDNNEIMYFIDSPTRKITAYDFDILLGVISNPKTVFDFDEHDLVGVPDGMTIDTNNNLWVADHGGGLVLNIDPREGKLLRKIEIPSKRVTSVTFGGLLLDTLYVTTAESEEEKNVNPYSGCVFAVKGLGVFGLAPNKFKLESQ